MCIFIKDTNVYCHELMYNNSKGNHLERICHENQDTVDGRNQNL